MSSLLARRDLSATPSSSAQPPTPVPHPHARLNFKSEPWEHWGNLILGHLDSKSHCSAKAELDPAFQQAFRWVSHPDIDSTREACECVDLASTTAQFQRVGCDLCGPSSLHPRLHPSPVSPGRCLNYWEGCLCLWASPLSPFEMTSHFLWRDACHLKEITSVLGMPCFIFPVPARVDVEGHQDFHKNRVNRMKLHMTSSCPCATLDSSSLPSVAQSSLG